MFKIKRALKIGLISTVGFLTATPKTCNHPQKLITKTENITFQKRTAQKIYHRFEDIPEISDEEVHLYDKNEYTYILNADAYQKHNKLELKRVLKDEVTEANVLSLIYQTECQSYIPKENEDQLKKYVIDMKLINFSGKYKGPSQMDDGAINNFIKFIAADKETRPYILPMLKTKRGDLDKCLNQLHDAFFDSNNNLRPILQRQEAYYDLNYRNIIIKSDAWKLLGSTKLKSYIKKQEYIKTQNHIAAQKRKNPKGPIDKSPITFTNTTNNYLYLTFTIPENILKEKLEEYNLSFYQIGRKGKTQQVIGALANSLNLKDNNGNVDATRVPTYVIAAALNNINATGNGLSALKAAKNLNPAAPLKIIAKKWAIGKSKKDGVSSLCRLNILTENIIKQYDLIELPGAQNLQKRYKEAVATKEKALIQNRAEKTLLIPPHNFSKER